MILPWRKFALSSPLRPEEAIEALEAAIENRRDWKQKMMSTGSGRFAGEVKGSWFSIFRDVNYKNSYVPRVQGTIAAAGAGSRIEVSMKLSTGIALFLGVWLGFTGIALLNALVSSMVAQGPPSYSFFGIIAIFALVGYGRALAGFNPEATKAETFLKETLKAERDKPADPSRQAV